MNTETRTCQNCKSDFTIEPQDFVFYEKMAVPPPTFCPLCRYQRRLMFRNERTLYSRTCDKCEKKIIAAYRPDAPVTVYCNACWWTGDWDGASYARDYDPSRNFFEQFREMQLTVPFPQLTQDYQTMTGSDYTNYIGHVKNCYLTFDCDTAENVLYCKSVVTCKDDMDCIGINNVNFSYELVTGADSSRLFYSDDCIQCLDTYFSRTCSGLQNCFGCVNLRNKKYCWFNEQLTKEEYEKRLAEYRLNTHAGVMRARAETDAFFLTKPVKFTHSSKNVNSSGEYIFHSKNAHDMYVAKGCENTRYCQAITMNPVKDSYDYTEWGDNAERIYESVTTGEGAANVRFSWASWRQGTMNLEYCMFVLSSHDMFGCIGMKKQEFGILNKQYSKDDFEKLRAQIISDMMNNPYVDANGRVWKYGEFFPYDLALCDYNESTTTQHFPLTREEALAKGYRWHDGERNHYTITKQSADLPDSIRDVTDEILKEIISCEKCSKAYRIIKAELDLLKNFDLPLPRNCPDCRHLSRLARMGKPFLYHRSCMKPGCSNEFEAAYAPDRPEIVYCESCFQQELV